MYLLMITYINMLCTLEFYISTAMSERETHV